jgi:hypothetical protein
VDASGCGISQKAIAASAIASRPAAPLPALRRTHLEVARAKIGSFLLRPEVPLRVKAAVFEVSELGLQKLLSDAA